MSETVDRSTSPPSAAKTLVAWANQQDHWLRGVVSEILETRQALSDDRLDHYYELLLLEKDLADGEPVLFPEVALQGAGPDIEEALVIASLRGVKNVNALSTDQEIVFNPRMTVLFGENGTGKTGYVRVLKRIASVRTSEPILPNIHKETGAPPPEAIVEYRLGDSTLPAVTWKNEAGVFPFTRMDVFDARGAAVHVDGELTYIYTPSDLALFKLIHQAVESTKNRLQEAKTETAPSGNPFVSRFPKDTRVYTKIETLGPASNVAELEALALVAASEEADLQPMRDRVDALRSNSNEARIRIASEEKTFLEAVDRNLEALRRFDSGGYLAAREKLHVAQNKHMAATKEAFAGYEIPAVLGDAWRKFIEAGEAYIAEAGFAQYPSAEAECVYCQQPLGTAAVQLIQKYREFCNNQLKADVDEAGRGFQNTSKELLTLDLRGLQEQLARRDKSANDSGNARPIYKALAEALRQAEVLQGAAKRQETLPEDDVRQGAERVSTAVKQDIRETSVLLQNLSKESEDRQKALAIEVTKLRELESRILLRELLPEIKSFISRAQWASKATTIETRFPAITRSLTEASKIASDTLLNQNFDGFFQNECLKLRAPKVTVDFPGRKGEQARRKSLTPNQRQKLSDILSEGEQKVIALADFLAEASLKQKGAPLVFDDPVNSLDYRRLQYVVTRLVELSEHRQVIVFSHNIWFVTELLSHFEKNRQACSYFDVSENQDEHGIVTPGSDPRIDTPKQREGKINNLIQEAKKKSDKVIQNALLEKAYEEFRGMCEVVVEQELFRGVTQRYQPHVAMTKLPQIHADRLKAAITIILPIYEKCCRVIASHSQPLETLNVRPTLQELEEDWLAFRQARQAYEKGDLSGS